MTDDEFDLLRSAVTIARTHETKRRSELITQMERSGFATVDAEHACNLWGSMIKDYTVE